MKLTLATSLVVGLFALPALAEGDAAAGEKAFGKCKSCHSITDGGGNVVVKGGKTGPNLWGLPGRTAGTQSDFKRFKKSVVEAGEAGLVWNEAEFLAWVQDPTGFLKATLDDSKARSGMSFRLRNEEDAKDIWAFIASVSN